VSSLDIVAQPILNDVFHSQLKLRREERQFSSVQLAHFLNITISSYCDLETYPEEWRMVLPLCKLRFLAALLEVDLTTVVGPRSSPLRFDPTADASVLIRSLRKEKNLSREVFAERVGFFPIFADIVEGHSLGLELYPLEVAVLVAGALEVPPNDFVHWLLVASP
jgi:hypothetical protein